jgi:hypothetical protein
MDYVLQKLDLRYCQDGLCSSEVGFALWTDIMTACEDFSKDTNCCVEEWRPDVLPWTVRIVLFNKSKKGMSLILGVSYILG